MVAKNDVPRPPPPEDYVGRLWDLPLDGHVLEVGAGEICEEIRKELGLGRPPRLERMPGSVPSHLPPP